MIVIDESSDLECESWYWTGLWKYLLSLISSTEPIYLGIGKNKIEEKPTIGAATEEQRRRGGGRISFLEHKKKRRHRGFWFDRFSFDYYFYEF